MKLFRTRDFFPRYQQGNFSKVFSSFDELTPDDRPFLIERVSGCERRANLIDQDKNLRSAVEPIVTPDNIVGSVQHVGSGVDLRWLWYATEESISLGATCLVGETTDTHTLVANRQC